MKTERLRSWVKAGTYRAVKVAPSFNDIKKLRKQIVLNSLFVKDYENRFDFDANEVCAFFDGYMEFLQYEYKDHTGCFAADVSDLFDYESDDLLERWMMIWEAGCGGTFTKYVEVEDEEIA